MKSHVHGFVWTRGLGLWSSEFGREELEPDKVMCIHKVGTILDAVHYSGTSREFSVDTP